ncbi:squalene synthase HpnC [Alicyclobacillus fastidiosus]|uniref:Squalene synthase HpnC n=1 Tax=Alicyclobacillus fastidiosus TaxID=392011 RepID=A0ABY6ZIJ3_9BACL|nr:squalene synthase HpnC [Alicyclobacillus fastidiosus]WAH42733.1 squalene synthase HpnC [Alicyclobacillus fastidiosus]GMA64634.1 squalene synthase HpnC [Alicyclobacillus fastidiosus]
MSTIPAALESAFADCERLATSHYENFSVLSLFIPRDLRPHFSAIYAYCRGVDDIGDEFSGDRLQALDEWAHQLSLCYTGTPTSPGFRALQYTIHQFDLPREPFDQLIEANRRDQHQSTYASWEDLLDYCRYSANPVGRMVLGLFGYQDDYRQRLSDCTCTALQIANHLQDVSRDVVRGRFYVPLEDLERFGSSLSEYRAGVITAPIRACIRHEVERTWELFHRGEQLEQTVPRRLRLQLRLYRLGGEAILRSLERQNFDPVSRRPVVSTQKKLGIACRALFKP